MLPVARDYKKMTSLWDEDLFEGFFPELFRKQIKNNENLFLSPKIDMSENEKEYIIKAEMPGIDRDKISVLVNDDYITIEASQQTQKEENGENKSIYREIKKGSFKRTFRIPENANKDNEKFVASYKDGILKITIEKKNEEIKNESLIKINFE